MTETTESDFNLDELGDDLKGYAETRIALAKLELAEKTSVVLAKMIQLVIVGVFIALFFGSITLAFALWISALVGSYAKGFLLVSGVYLVLALIVRLSAPLWLPTLRDSFIKSFFDGN